MLSFLDHVLLLAALSLPLIAEIVPAKRLQPLLIYLSCSFFPSKAQTFEIQCVKLFMGEAMLLVMLMSPSARFSHLPAGRAVTASLFLWGQTQLQTTDDAD